MEDIIKAMSNGEFSSEAIVQRMRNSLKNPASKIEGSFAMDSIYAISQELSRVMYERVINYIDLVMLDTAPYEYLDRKGLDYGLERNPATQAVGYVQFTGKAGTVIPKETTVLSEDSSYTTDYEAIIPSSEKVSILCTCTESGSQGNILAGAITQIRAADAIDGVSVTNEEPFLGGTEEEDDESYRNRIYEKIRLPLASGNVNSYIYWAKQVSGVGNARCVPLWNGAGTVKVIILGSDGKEPDDEILQNVADYIETQRPIGAQVTVAKAEAHAVSIDATIKISSGYRLNDIKNDIDKTIREYLTGIAYEEENKTLSYFKISDLIFNVNGVADVLDYTINDGKTSITAGASEFFELQEVIINEN